MREKGIKQLIQKRRENEEKKEIRTQRDEGRN
jgi:hypothetical protein